MPHKSFFKKWMILNIFLIICMVFIGGVTRLTDSGLSITEWRPIMGAIPPMNEHDWQEAFSLYKKIPEYTQVNKGMSLDEFKFIYFWEYFHRLFGRLIGLVYFIGMAYLFIKGGLSKSWKILLLSGFLMGGSQGFLGWYMVQSGLSERVDVSHFRLAAHFGLAMMIMSYLFMLYLSVHQKDTMNTSTQKVLVKKWPYFIQISLLIVQVIYGAFVAGMDAGLSYNTFPLMGKSIHPSESLIGLGFSEYFFHHPSTIQFLHRFFATLLVLFSIIGLYRYRKTEFFRIQFVAFLALTIQYILGVWTLLSLVRIEVASAHQVWATIVVLVYTYFSYHIITRSKKRQEKSSLSTSDTTGPTQKEASFANL